MSVSERVLYRANALKHWLRRSLQLRDDEERTFASGLERGVAEVLKGKRLLLWREMLQSIGHSDMRVCEEFFAGTCLTGQTDRTGL